MVDIRDKMEIVKSVFYILMPHIPHQVREHDIHILPPFKPAVHICISEVMPEIIRPDTHTVPLFLRKSRIPDL